MFIDTHTHLYLENFDSDRAEILNQCKSLGIHKLLLPNIDHTTLSSVKELAQGHPDLCYAMNGLHPCYVKENVDEVLNELKEDFAQYDYTAVGEIGIDFYWDTTFTEEQIHAFKEQINWSKEMNIPFVIHSRSSLDLTIRIVKDSNCKPDQCIFHCFDGKIDQANKIIDMGMKMGIGGPITYKKSKLVEVVRSVDLKHIVLETDSPYLTPSPHRGERNESSYIPLIAKRIAEVKDISIEEVAEVTTQNAKEILRRTLGKRVYPKRVSRVRIPHSPHLKVLFQKIFVFLGSGYTPLICLDASPN